MFQEKVYLCCELRAIYNWFSLLSPGNIMKRFILSCFGLMFVVFAAFGQSLKSNITYVDPTIGGVGGVLQPTRPIVHLPNEIVRVFPMRHDQLDDQIWYFPLTIASYRVAFVFALMPVAGSVDATIWNREVRCLHG